MKQKTHSGAKKRFRTTKTGKVLGRKASARHLLMSKSKGQKQMQNKAFQMSDADKKNVKKLLSNG
jgi:large subunit ribosomal protein L35